MRIFAILLLLAVAFAATVPFIDMWEEIDDADCHLKEVKHICLRVYQSVGKIEPNFAKNIVHLKGKNATISAYMVPAQKVDVAKQVAEIIAAIKDVKLDYFWVAIEGRDWSQNREENAAFVTKLLAELSKSKLKIGIQTDLMSWFRIMGRGASGFSKYPLWHVRHDNNPEDPSFRPFGGWNNPKAKQYTGNAEKCGDTVNLDSLF